MFLKFPFFGLLQFRQLGLQSVTEKLRNYQQKSNLKLTNANWVQGLPCIQAQGARPPQLPAKEGGQGKRPALRQCVRISLDSHNSHNVPKVFEKYNYEVSFLE
jgi:hypothetical protein